MNLTQIHQIEVTTRCNLRCKYCPHPKMQRPKEDMAWETYDQALAWVDHFVNKGTQGELSFTGIGESTLHPDFGHMLIKARVMFPDIPIVFSTNGMPSFTEEIASICNRHNIEVMVSVHRPEMAGKAIQLCKKYSILKYINSAFATSAFDWAGDVDWFVSAPAVTCEYLKSGWGVVLFDGKITTCCLDSEDKGVIGHVSDPVTEIPMSAYSLCETCHMKVP